MTVSQAAAQLGVPSGILSRIPNGNAPVTAEMALRQSIGLDTTPEVWLNMQGAWDLWQAEQQGFPNIKPLRLASC